MNVKILNAGEHTKHSVNGEKKKRYHQNIAIKSLEPPTISQLSPQLTDETEFPSLSILSNTACINPLSSGATLKYSDKLKLHSNQNTAQNYCHSHQEPIRKDLNEASYQTSSSPHLRNKWFQGTSSIKLDEKSISPPRKQNEHDKPDFISRRELNSTLCDRRSHSNHSPKESLAKYEYKNHPQWQKQIVNKKLESRQCSFVKSVAENPPVGNQTAKSSPQVQSKNEIKLILGKNPAKEAGNNSSDASKKKKKRKSKVKRQVALQTGKITVLTPEVHSKILNQTSVLSVQNHQTVLTDINDEDEYPELGKSIIPTSQKENYPKKEEPIPEDSKKTEIGEQKVEISLEEKHLVTKNGGKESGFLSLANDKSVTEKKGKEVKPVHPNDPITVSFFDILVNKNCKAKVKDLKTEADPSLSVGLYKAKTKKNSIHPHNLLDSSPAVKRGKEREKPKPKKPSQLKKIILMDRKARREQLLQLKSNNLEQECTHAMGNESVINETRLADVLDVNDSQTQESLCEILQLEIPEENLYLFSCKDDSSAVLNDDFDDLRDTDILPTYETDFDVSDILSTNKVCYPEVMPAILNPKTGVDEYTEGEQILMNISVPLPEDGSASHKSDLAIVIDATLSTENKFGVHPSPNSLDSFLTDVKPVESADKEKAVKILLHTRNFREYCNHLISKDIDDVVYALLDDLARFQDRMHQKDPIKARMKRRMIYGVKEVKKHVKLKKMRCIIVAADIENIETHGGLNDLLNDIKSLAADHHIPCIFALGRKSLGKVCRKPVPVSCVGVFNYEGSEVNFKRMIELQVQSKTDYAEISAKLLDCLTDEQISSLLRAKREAPETLRAIRTAILGDFFSEDKTKVSSEPDITNKK